MYVTCTYTIIYSTYWEIFKSMQYMCTHVYRSIIRIPVQVLDDYLSSFSTNQCKTFEVKLLQFEVDMCHYNNMIITNT